MPNTIGPANRTVSLIYRYGRRFLARELKAVSVDVGQYPFLIAVLRNPGITQEQLSEKLGMDRGTTARSVAALEEQGYFTRETDAHDRRINHIYSTEKADRLREELYAVSDRLHSAYMTGFSDEEKEMLSGLFRRLSENAVAYYDEASQEGEGQ